MANLPVDQFAIAPPVPVSQSPVVTLLHPAFKKKLQLESIIQCAQQRQRIFVLSLALMAVIFAFQYIHILQQPLNTVRDNAFLLQCGKLLAAGKVPYVDFFETNPPLAIYLMSLPAYLAQVLKVHIITVFLNCVFVLSIGSAAASACLLYRAKDDRSFPCFPAILAALAVFSAQLNAEFGQREHLFVLLFLPFFFCRWLRWNDRPVHPLVSACIGAAAGVGLCLKPHFLLIPLAMEIYWCVANKKIRPLFSAETFGAGAIGISYALHFLLLPSVMQQKFFHHILPAMVKGYGIYGCPWMKTLTMYFQPAAVTCALGWLLRKRSSLIMPFIMWSAAAFVVFVVQSKGWLYQSIPLFAPCLMLVAIEITCVVQMILNEMEDSIRGLVDRLGMPVVSALLSIGVLCCARPYIGFDFCFFPQDYGQVPALNKVILEQTNKNDRVMILSTGLEPAYPALLVMEREPGSRYPQSEIFPMLEHNKNSARTEAERWHWQMEQDQVVRELSDDVHSMKPALVVIENCKDFNNVLPKPPLWYFNRNGFVAQLNDYHMLGSYGGYVVWKKNG